MKKTLSKRIGQVATMATVLGAGMPALAQESSNVAIEEIVVTGSLIRGTPEDAAMPVDTIGTEELDKQGAPPPLEMLKNLSYMNGIVGESNAFVSGRGQASQGIATVNLRGLGAARTLVLLNGKRLAADDANRIPTNAIQRVEVLKDGGAVTYGSDAIGGVVNYITKENVEGFELSTDYRAIEDSDGNYNIGLSWGTVTDNSDFFASLNYYHRSELEVSDVDYALQPYSKNPQGGWGTGANPGKFGSPSVGFEYIDPACEAFGGVVTDDDDVQVPLSDPDAANCRTRYTEWYNLIDEQDTYQGFASYNLDLGDATDLHIEALYAQTEVPHASSAGSYTTANYVPGALIGGSPFQLNPYYILGATNPYNPFGSSIPIILNQWRPYFAGGNPAFGYEGAWTNYDRQQYRVSTELTGMLTDNIGYTTSLTYSKSEDERQEWDIRIDKLQAALLGMGGPDRDLALNPFSSGIPNIPGVGENPFFNPATDLDEQRAVAEWLMEQHTAVNEDELTEFNFVLDGELPVELGGGGIGWAAGAQYRHETEAIDYSNLSNQNVNPCPIYGSDYCVGTNLQGASPWGFLATYVPYDEDREVKAIFGEMMIPFTDNFTAQLAARYEDYGDVGGDSFDPNLRLRWQATDWLAFRASAGTTFRVAGQGSLRPVEATGFQSVKGNSTPIRTSGNPDLEPEEAANYNIGIMLTGANYDFTIDFWRYKVDQRLTTEPLTSMVQTFWPAGNSPNCGLPQAFVDRFDLSAPCGSDPSTLRITGVSLDTINAGEITNDGVDLQGSYSWDEVGPGSLTLGGSATWINQFETEGLTVEGVQVETGFDGVGKFNSGTSLFPLPEWRGNLFLNYSTANQNLRWTVNYIDSYQDQRDIFDVSRAGQTIDSYVTHDIAYRYDVNESITLNAVLDNATDEEPPFVRAEMNYDPVTHNPLTRTFKVGAKVRF